MTDDRFEYEIFIIEAGTHVFENANVACDYLRSTTVPHYASHRALLAIIDELGDGEFVFDVVPYNKKNTRMRINALLTTQAATHLRLRCSEEVAAEILPRN